MSLTLGFVLLFSSFSLAAEPVIVAPEISVLGEASKKSTLDFIPTVSEISGKKLQRKKQTSLGETLANEVGVSSSFFGPNASRPVIRGMDGERIRVLNNGTGVLDASAASQDHEVAVEPMAVDRIEIVRGPSALLYGSSAVGGVVNVVTNRILEKSPEGLNGKFDSHYSSVDGGGVGALGVNYGKGSWAFHFDGSNRASSDYHIPDFARTDVLRATKPLDADKVEGFHSVPNSDNRTQSGAFGAAYLFNDGFAGASYSKYNSLYGTVAEQKVKIKMQQEKADAAFGMKNLGWLESLRFKNTYSNYRHEEVNNGTTGTVFTNVGDEARIEMKHQRVGDFQGIFGFQGNTFDFEAIGDERFLPKTSNQGLAGFIYEEAQYGNWIPSFGLRVDASKVKANETFTDVTAGNPGEANAGGPGATRSFNSGSASVGAKYNLDEHQALVLNVGFTERAPNYQELFANGPHLATAAFERGDANLGLEKSQSVELSYRQTSDDIQGSAGVFLQNFDHYISLSPKTGGGFDPDGAPGNRDLTLYQYEAVSAQFYGIELEFVKKHNLQSGGVLESTLKFDQVKARNTSAMQNLPRITPIRETISVAFKGNKVSGDFEVQHVEPQRDLAPNETATDGYFMLNAGSEMPVTLDTATLSLYLRLNNILDVTARNHVSVLKDIAPLPGRNVTIGLQAAF